MPRLSPPTPAPRIAQRVRPSGRSAGDAAGSAAGAARAQARMADVLEPVPAPETLPFAAQQIGQEWLPPAPEIDFARAAQAYRRRAGSAQQPSRLRAVA